MIVRPARGSDLAALIELTRNAGAGLTSLPASEERMAQRVRWAELSFRGEAERADADYLFVLETDDGKVVGISAMTGAVGLRQPWYNYRLGLMVCASLAPRLHREIPTLLLPSDRTGGPEMRSVVRRADCRR